MAEGPQIIRPSFSADRLPRVRLVAVGLVCLIAGFALSRASLDRDRIEDARRHGEAPSSPSEEHPTVASQAAPDEPLPQAAPDEPLPQAAPDEPLPQAAPDEASVRLAEAPTPSSEALGVAGAESPVRDEVDPPPIADSAAMPPPTSPGPAPSRRRLVIRPGRIAYLRCDGAELQRGPFPCPRDWLMERAVFTTIRTLPYRCQELAAIDSPGRGRADAWLMFEDGTLSSLRVRDLPDQDTAEAIRGCLEGRLSSLRPSVRPSRMTVSFQFDLR